MKEWDEVAESFSDFVREGKDYFRDALNNPATFKLIGNVKGKKVLDLACGEGYNTRVLAKKGATVVGVDFSEKLIELARHLEIKERLGITYYVADAANMEKIQSNHFDLVTCFMALQDVEHYKQAISEVARVLKENGRFIFSIPHPCFIGHVVKDGGSVTRWMYEDGTTEKSFVIRQYFGIGKYEVQWDMERIAKPFKTTAFHRTLTDYFLSLHRSGLLVSRLVEPRPTLKAVSKYPSLAKRLRIPQSIVIEAVKKEL
ncbi:MAG: class I SAM-dependent methyltransferase [Candidatus Bathyarchaeota archaeon]|nr:class I SAM-dependent methyltransferase [Candidatus Bathyarchaeota archaeon]MDH5687235.1 class I SAM-dependent methyltransferase [Candidatus Bathyarchaeota archaeon]